MKRTRNRRRSKFTAAEIQFLSGHEQDGANPFALIELEHRDEPARIQYAEELVERAEAAGIVDQDRATELRKMLARELAQMRRAYPGHPAFVEA